MWSEEGGCPFGALILDTQAPQLWSFLLAQARSDRQYNNHPFHQWLGLPVTSLLPHAFWRGFDDAFFTQWGEWGGGGEPPSRPNSTPESGSKQDLTMDGFKGRKKNRFCDERQRCVCVVCPSAMKKEINYHLTSFSLNFMWQVCVVCMSTYYDEGLAERKVTRLIWKSNKRWDIVVVVVPKWGRHTHALHTKKKNGGGKKKTNKMMRPSHKMVL